MRVCERACVCASVRACASVCVCVRARVSEDLGVLKVIPSENARHRGFTLLF